MENKTQQYTKDKKKQNTHPDGSWRASKINTMIGAVEWWRESVRLSSDAGCPCQNLLIGEGRECVLLCVLQVFVSVSVCFRGGLVELSAHCFESLNQQIFQLASLS